LTAAILSIGNIQRLLTSGQANTAFEGADLIAALCVRAKGRLSVMPGGGVTEQNVAKIISLTGAREVHFSLRKSHGSGMQYRASGVYMGGLLRPEEYSVSLADPSRIRLAAQAAAKL
jgi:copper homeostasis protein